MASQSPSNHLQSGAEETTMFATTAPSLEKPAARKQQKPMPRHAVAKGRNDAAKKWSRTTKERNYEDMYTS